METLEDIVEVIHEFVAERMNNHLMELEKQPFFKTKNDLKNDLYEEIFEVVKNTNKDEERKFEDLIGQTDILHTYYEDLHYVVGIVDGIRLLNMFKL